MFIFKQYSNNFFKNQIKPDIGNNKKKKFKSLTLSLKA